MKKLDPYYFLRKNLADTSKVIIMYYPVGAGGLFLNNCLNFSDDISCFNCNNIQEKLQLLISTTKSQSIIWNDPSLESSDCSGNQYNILTNHPYPSLKKRLSEDLKSWVNCNKIIYFKNSELFVKLRSCNLNEKDIFEKNKIKMSPLQFINMSEEKKYKLMCHFNDNNQSYSQCVLSNKKLFYVWDTNWYFSLNEILIHIKELYDILNLSGFNSDVISEYYKVWIDKIDELKIETLQKFNEKFNEKTIDNNGPSGFRKSFIQ
jgi:hypothetical protein